MRYTPEEKLELIQLARYSGLGFEKSLNLFGIKPYRVWRWIRNLGQKGLAGLTDQPPLPKSRPLKHFQDEEDLIMEKAGLYTHLNHRNLAHQIFRDENTFVSESLVYRVLKRHNLVLSKPTYKITASDKWKNKPKSPNELWHIDISYILCGLNKKGKAIFWYLVVVLDGYSRYVISWELFPDMSKERCFQVVDQAVFLAQLPPEKRPTLLSDNGSQFRAKKSKEFFKNLLNIKQIFSAPNHPQTNGKVERLFESAKYEALYRNDYNSPPEAKEILLNFFDYYNNHRLHQALEYRTPQEVYYKLNEDYSQKRLKAKIEKIILRKNFNQTQEMF